MKKHYYVRILFFLSLASLLPVLGLGTALIRSNEALISRSGEAAALHSLKQISSTTEMVFKSIDDTILLFRQNRAFRSYEGFPDKEYFRNFQSHYNLERIEEYSAFLDLRAEINRSLEQLAVTREYIRSVYYFDSDSREVFSLEYIPTPIQAFPHREWYDELQGLREPTVFGPVLNSKRQKVLYLIYPESIGSSSVFIVDVDLNGLYAFLSRRAAPEDTDMFFVLRPGGNPLIYDPSREREVYALAWNDGTREDGLRTLRDGDRTFLLSSYRSRLSGLSFNALLDKSEFSRILNGNRRFLLFLALPLFTLNILLLFLLGRMLYSPINRLVGAVGDEGVENLSALESWIGRSVSTMKRNERLLEETAPVVRLSYLSALLDGDDWERHPPELPFGGGELRILCGFFDQPGTKGMEALRQWGRSQGKSLCFSREGLIVLILEEGKMSYEDFCLETERFTGELYERDSIRLYIAVSERNWPLSLLNRGYEEVLVKLKDWLKYPWGSPLQLLGSGATGPGELLILPEGFCVRLLDALKGEKDYKPLLKEQFERIDLSVHSASEAHYFYVHILSAILLRLSDRGLDYYTSSSQGEELFVSLVNLKTRDAVEAWFHALCEDLAQRLRGQGSRISGERYIRQAEVLIEESLGEDLTLASVAEGIGISSFYLSRLFKEVRDESFTQYLTGQRMKRARRLLEERDNKVKDVSRRVGYWSSNYFIKVFKKYYGVTPGEFRSRVMKDS